MKRRTNILCPESGLHTTSFGRILKWFLILAVMVAGTEKALGTDFTTRANFKHLESNFQTNGNDQLLTANDCQMVKLSWSGIENNTETINGNKYYKFAGNDSYVKVKFYHEYNPDAPFVAGDVLTVNLMVTDASVEPGFIIKTDKGKERTVLAATGSAYANRTISTTLQENDINTDGSVTIYRTGGGHAIRYFSFEVSMKRYNYNVILQQTEGGKASFVVNSGNSSIRDNSTSVTRADVADGAKITLTATPDYGYLFWGWQRLVDEVWKESWDRPKDDYTNNPCSATVTEAVTLRPNFTKGIMVNAYTNDANLGTINIRRGTQNATSWHVTPWPGETTFIATPQPNCVFKGWYKDCDHTVKVSDNKTYVMSSANGNQITDVDVNLFAWFEADASFSPEIPLDFDISSVGHGSNIQWDNGTLAPTGPTDNWVSVKTIPASERANYTGVELTYMGDASRIILMYEGDETDAGGNPKMSQTITKIDEANEYTRSYFSWSMLGLPNGNTGKLEIRLAGKQEWGVEYNNMQTTYSNARLVKFAEPANAQVDDDYVKFNLDSRTNLYSGKFGYAKVAGGARSENVEWVVKNVGTEKFFTLKSAGTSNNYVDVLDNVTNYNASKYTGVHLDYKGDDVRVIVRSGSKTFQYTADGVADKTSVHIAWEDFINIDDNDAKMTADEISAITAICVAGCRRHETAESTDIYNVWLDKMYRYTVDTQGRDKGESWDPETGILTYKIKVEGKDVDVKLLRCNYDSRHQNDSGACGGLKLQKQNESGVQNSPNSEFLVNVPDGYKISRVKVGLGESSSYNVSFNYGHIKEGNGTFICYDRANDDNNTGIRLVIKGEQTQCNELHITYVTFDVTTPDNDEVYDTDFTGYFNYNNRLYAQWNFDLCDKFRFNEAKAEANTARWTVEKNSDGTRVFKNKVALGQTGNDADKGSYEELTYDGTNVVPVTEGLKFKADAGAVQIRLENDKDSKTGAKAYLVLNSGVKMYVPYVENSYRNDLGHDAQPNADSEGNDTQDDPKHFENCMHHLRRDILYMSLKQGSIWNNLKNVCIDDAEKSLFSAGGEERVNDCHFFKMNYNGNHGVPCIMQIDKQTFIKRMGVNRNLTYSFYTEYIGDLDLDKPVPHTRILGSPSGWKVANVESTAVTYTDAIALTYGGWKTTENKNTYKDYDGNDVTDEWSELGVYNGNENFVTYSQLAGETVTKDSRVPVATDGFPVLSHMPTPAASETLMPQGSTGKYHLESQGKFSPTDTENYTPWTLPCRGGYIKFEPAIPGVLNVDILQKGNNYTKSVGNVYFIVDEFGRNVPGVFHKTASNNQIDKCPSGGYFLQGHSDNVKYSFNVYPGKTYYIFSNDYGMGFAGYYFEPYMYRTSPTDEMAREEIRMNALTLSESTDYAYDSSLNEKHSVLVSPGKNGNVEYAVKYDNTAVEVTMDLKFTANTWGSICLPFSMNQNSMEQVFGKGTKVILLRDIQARNGEEKTTANFVMHENQDILAGYPYFIRPTKDVNGFTTNAYLYPQAGQPSIVKIASEGIDFTDAEKDFGGLEGYTFTGNFAKETLPKYSYVMSKTGKMTRLTKDTAAKPYRAFLKANPDAPDLQELSLVFFGDMPEDEEVTAVDDVVFEHKGRSASKDVYNMGGQLVRKKADSLLGLPKGTYIAGGRKYVVR